MNYDELYKFVVTTPIMGKQILYKLGDCPNVETKTLGGHKFWRVLDKRNGLTLQYNKILRRARILDENDVRKAWGSKEIMEEKFKRLARTKGVTREHFFEPGDVIGVQRNPVNNMGRMKHHIPGKLYEHYGIYVGDGMVVHYSEEESDMGGVGRILKEGTKAFKNVHIQKTTIDQFIDGDNCFVLHFMEGCRQPRKIQERTSFAIGDREYYVPVIGESTRYRVFSPEETVERALSQLGEGKGEYDLVKNNCEHFAIWCKTGVKESIQVKNVIKTLENIIMAVGNINGFTNPPLP